MTIHRKIAPPLRGTSLTEPRTSTKYEIDYIPPSHVEDEWTTFVRTELHYLILNAPSTKPVQEVQVSTAFRALLNWGTLPPDNLRLLLRIAEKLADRESEREGSSRKYDIRTNSEFLLRRLGAKIEHPSSKDVLSLALKEGVTDHWRALDEFARAKVTIHHATFNSRSGLTTIRATGPLLLNDMIAALQEQMHGKRLIHDQRPTIQERLGIPDGAVRPNEEPVERGALARYPILVLD